MFHRVTISLIALLLFGPAASAQQGTAEDLPIAVEELDAPPVGQATGQVPGQTPGAPAVTSQARAPEADIFRVSGVAVDETGATASEARERAFLEGQRAALEQLLSRLGVGRDQLDPASLTNEEMERLLQGFQIEEERTSAGRYVASLSYSFRPEEVRAMLRDRAVVFSETASKPVVVIPVYRSPEGPRLWDSPNAWLDAWLDFPGSERLVPIFVPFGDLQDVQDVSVEDALAGDREALNRLAQRYGAGEALVVVAEPQGDALNVAVNRYGQSGGTTGIRVTEGADEPARMALAVEQVAGSLEEAWRAQTRVQSGQRSTVALLVPIGGGEDWFQIQSRLQRVPTVVRTQIVSLSSREAVLELDYIGNEDQLRLALAQQDLAIDPGPFAPQLRLAR